MQENLLDELLIPSVDEHELLSVIQRHYGSARSTPEDDVVFPNSSSYSLKIRSKDGKLQRIEPGPAFSKEELEALKGKTRTQLVESPGTGVAVCILFSSQPVKGVFCSTSAGIQILPLPPQAPHPNVLIADHPFILEFRIRKSHDGFVTNNRHMRGRLEWSWVLNALLRRRIKCIGHRSKHLWVWWPDGPERTPCQAQIKWAQEYYMIDDFVGLKDDFTGATLTEISQVPHNEYYESLYLRSNDFLVPDSLSRLLDLAAGTSIETRRRFMRAAQWMYVANPLWDHHISSYYISLIAAVESLAFSQASPNPCPTCGKDTSPGPTQRFQDFVERYAPSSDQSERNKKWLYNIRSGLSHGRYLLHVDETPWDWSLNTTYLKQQDAYSQLSQLVQQVIVNWLVEQSPSSPVASEAVQ